MHRPGHRPQLGDFHLRAGGELGVRSVWGVLSRMHLGDTRVETSSGPWGAWLWSLRKISGLGRDLQGCLAHRQQQTPWSEWQRSEQVQ